METLHCKAHAAESDRYFVICHMQFITIGKENGVFLCFFSQETEERWHD